jgi:enoyl-CoA hydratase
MKQAISNQTRGTKMSYESILVKKEGKVSTIILNRPQSLNFLDPLMAEEIEKALRDAEKDCESEVGVR